MSPCRSLYTFSQLALPDPLLVAKREPALVSEGTMAYRSGDNQEKVLMSDAVGFADSGSVPILPWCDCICCSPLCLVSEAGIARPVLINTWVPWRKSQHHLTVQRPALRAISNSKCSGADNEAEALSDNIMTVSCCQEIFHEPQSVDNGRRKRR